MKQTVLTIVILIIFIHYSGAAKVCDSINIKHEKDLQDLRDCRVILGHVRLSNFRVFETSEISSQVEEIADYLLIYRVEGLETLEHIFPNLTIIRGQKLLFDKYSLIVYENRNIRDLGLKSLLKIQRGLVQINTNPVLCFADTVNWVYLVEDHSMQLYTLKDNRDPNDCALCLKNVKNSETEYLKTSCWNLKNFQRKKPIPHLNHCPAECGMSGCTDEGRCCSPLCLTGCFAENCRICKNFRNIQGTCVETCNVPFYTLGDECITEEECRKRSLIPHARSCISECPRSYRKMFVNDVAQCDLLCDRNFTIHTKDDLEEVRDCVIIKGSLHIELKEDKTKIIADLENVLGDIKEISGSLKIVKSPQIVSLGFFRKLDTIKGDKLIDNEISLYVVDNFHLEEIWPDNHKVAILKGRVFFHLNPRLCYEKILQLMPSIRGYDELRAKDASRNSNGERVVCGNNIRVITPVIEDLNATAVRIKVGTIAFNDRDSVLGYMHHYKEAPVKNVTMYDGRHGCGHDHWRMDMSLNRNIRHVISNLKPYTQYAFFVKTLTMVDYHAKMDWYSPIQYFRTLPMKPGPVQKIYCTVISSTSIIVHWWPPKDPNGVIDKYLVHYEKVEPQLDLSKTSGYNSSTIHKDCECNILRKTPEPPPDDANYYNRDQIVFDDALPNLIFVSRRTNEKLEEERAKEDQTRRKRETNVPVKIANSLETTSTAPTSAAPTTDSAAPTPNSAAPTTSTAAPTTNLSAEAQAIVEAEKEIERRFFLHMANLERLAYLEQDTGPEKFAVLQAPPICSITNPPEKYQEEHKCAALERYEGIEIPGKIHSYTLDNLEPDAFYRISIRACVEGLQNACGVERAIKAETVTKSLDYFIKGP